MLWFAFKMCSFVIDKYLNETNYGIHLSCDLLSKCVLSLLINTAEVTRLAKNGLWFAFKMCSFVIDKY